MANEITEFININQLPHPDVPITGDELVEVMQGGKNVQTPVDALTAKLRADLADPAKGAGMVAAPISGDVSDYIDYVLLELFQSDSEAYKFAYSQDKLVYVFKDTTVRIPSDMPSAQDAIRLIVPLGPSAKVNILFDSGFSPINGISVENGDFSMFSISSEDPVVTINSAINTPFLYANCAKAPLLNCLIDGNSKLFQGAYYIGGSYGEISANCGVKNVQERGLYVNNSRITGISVDFSGAGQAKGLFGRALWAARCADVSIESANLKGCLGTSTAVYLSRASTVHSPYSEVSAEFAPYVIWVHRGSTYNGQETELINGGDNATINATRGSTVVLNGTKLISGSKSSSVISAGGSTVNIGEGVTLTPAPGNTGPALSSSSVSRIAASNVKISAGFKSAALATGASDIEMTLAEVGAVTGTIGVESRRGSRITVTQAEIRTGTPSNDLRVTEGGQIFADGCKTTNSTGNAPLVTDTNVNGFGGFNAIATGGRGIIWAG